MQFFEKKVQKWCAVRFFVTVWKTLNYFQNGTNYRAVRLGTSSQTVLNSPSSLVAVENPLVSEQLDIEIAQCSRQNRYRPFHSIQLPGCSRHSHTATICRNKRQKIRSKIPHLMNFCLDFELSKRACSYAIVSRFFFDQAGQSPGSSKNWHLAFQFLRQNNPFYKILRPFLLSINSRQWRQYRVF